MSQSAIPWDEVEAPPAEDSAVEAVYAVAKLAFEAEALAREQRVREVFDSPTDPDWNADRREFGAPGVDDPWGR